MLERCDLQNCLSGSDGMSMDHTSGYPTEFIADILQHVKTVAVIGASPNPARPSNEVARFLMDGGYEVIPVNPNAVGQSLNGRPFVASLAEIEKPVDMVDVFRASGAL